MKEFLGTPGPWRIGILGNVQSERGEFICESDKNKASEEENNANNKLISCAPEMLNMMHNIISFYKQQGNLISLDVSKIKDLIKKATTL